MRAAHVARLTPQRERAASGGSASCPFFEHRHTRRLDTSSLRRVVGEREGPSRSDSAAAGQHPHEPHDDREHEQDDADPEEEAQRIDEFSSAVGELPLGKDITVELVNRDFALAKLQAAAEDIASNPEAWVSFFGATVTSLEIDEVSGVVYVGSDDGELSSSTFKHSDGIVFVAGGNSGSIDFQSRVSDTSP